MERDNLMAGPPATYLMENEEAAAALRAGASPSEVAARFPAYSAAWAALAEAAFASGDQLRRSGWRGTGPIPWEHEPNRGFLRSLAMLGRAADAIGEDDEAQRCDQFLRESSAAAAAALRGSGA
jgi:hypothetical protein